MIDVAQSGFYVGDCRELLDQLPEQCVQTCITSPPYWGLRDYGTEAQIGLEQTPNAYVDELVRVFRGVRRALRDDGTLWLNLGDSYTGCPNSGGSGKQDTAYRAIALPTKRGAGLKSKDLIGIPWRVAFALQADGWYLRSDIIWHKPNPMPESVTDRPTRAHEYVFLLAKSARYFYDAPAIAEASVSTGPSGNGYARQECISRGGRGQAQPWEPSANPTRNRRSVWSVCSQPFVGAHFATMPPSLVDPCVLAGSRVGDLVLDPFFGSGTTGMVAEKHGRRWVGFDLNADYAEIAKGRTAQRSLVLGDAHVTQ